MLKKLWNWMRGQQPPSAAAVAGAARCCAPRAYMLGPQRRRGRTEIMMYGWLDLRPISDAEYEYWQNHALPFGHSIVMAHNS